MKRKSYEVSSSDDDSTKKTAICGKTSLSPNDGDHELLADILKTNKIRKLNFKNWKSSNTLFYDDIRGDDEIYLVQCPKNTDLKALSNANVDFDSVVSSIKCRVNKSKEKLTVFSVDDFPSQVNLALPNRATKSFQLRALPVAGRLVMQKNIRSRQIKTKNEEDESSVIDLESGVEIMDEIKSESSTPTKKRS